MKRFFRGLLRLAIYGKFSCYTDIMPNGRFLKGKDRINLINIISSLPYIYININIYKYTYIHTYIHTCIHTYIHKYLPTCLPAYLPTYGRTDIHTYNIP